MKCTKCLIDKDERHFYVRKDRGTLYTQCKECVGKRGVAWRRENTDKTSKYFQEYKERHPERYRESVKKRNKKSYQNNKLRHTISNAVYRSLSNRRKQVPTFKSLGYTLEQLRQHLEGLFVDGMSWDNYGEWHVDHIAPLCSFNITSQECEDFKKAWKLENLQPLWASENVRKGGHSCP